MRSGRVRRGLKLFIERRALASSYAHMLIVILFLIIAESERQDS